MFRRFRFSLLSLMVLVTASSAGSVLIGRETRHREAVHALERLGGHISYGHEARIVYLWRHDDASSFGFDYVVDEKELIGCLQNLKPFTRICILSNQAHLEAALRAAFPDVQIERGTGGII